MSSHGAESSPPSTDCRLTGANALGEWLVVKTSRFRQITGKCVSSLRLPSRTPIGRPPPPARPLAQREGAGRAAKVGSRDNPAVPAHPGRMGPHPRFQTYVLSPHNSDNPGTKLEFSRVDTAPHGVETSITMADRLLAGAGRACVTRGEDRAPYLVYKTLVSLQL